MQHDAPFTCANCGAQARGNYCPACGQKRLGESDLYFKKVMAQAFREITDLDGKIWKTLYYLFRYPGKLTEDFIGGKRKQYINPFKLFLFASLLYFLVMNLSARGTIMDIEIFINLDFYGIIERVVMPLWDPALQTRDEFLDGFMQKTKDINNLFLYSSVLVHAAFLKLLFLKKRIPYAIHLVFALHFVCFGFIRDVACFPLLVYFRSVTISLLALHSVWFLYHAIKRCYHQAKPMAALLALVIYAGLLMIYSANLALAVYLTAVFW